MNLSTRGFRGGGVRLLPLALMLVPTLVSAGPITGEIVGGFGITGPGVLVFKNGADYIEFCNTVSGTSCSGAVTGTGTISVTGPGTGACGSGAGDLDVSAGNPGTIDNTTDQTPPTAPYTYLPIDSAVSIDNYLTLAGYSYLDFQADFLPLVSCTTTATQSCVGPFELSSITVGGVTNTSVTMDVQGVLINENGPTGAATSDLSIIITGQYAGETIAQVESGATSTTGAFSNSWSASVTTSAIPSVPEPGSGSMMLLAGGGLVALSRVRRRRKP